MRLAGKTVVISAAGQGIGRATALACAQQGAEVIATDIDRPSLEALAAADQRIVIESLDVTDRVAIDEFAARHGAVDGLFNCAGWVPHGTILDCQVEDWDRSFRINVTSMYDMIRGFLPAMLQAEAGSIVNMSSVASSIIGARDRFAYGAAKAAVIGMTKSISTDFVGQGIRCNAVCPGTVQTPSLEERIRAAGDGPAAREAFVARQPMGRLGKPAEIANLVIYLLSDESAYTTGTIHVIDGGWSQQ